MRVAKGLVVHAALWALAYAGLAAGNAAAENVLLFALWAVSVLLLFGAAFAPSKEFPPRSRIGVIQTMSSVGLCAVMAAESRFVLASVIVLSLLALEVKREAAKREAAK